MNTLVETTQPRKRPKTTEQLIAELYRTDSKAEIINGKIVKFMSTGFEPGRAGMKIVFRLLEYELKTKSGFAIPDNIGFLVNLPHRKSFSPDAAFFTGQKSGMKFLQGAPVFAVEVRSENDYGETAEQKIADKRRDYFLAGTEIVWDVDLQSQEIIKSYHRDNPNEPFVFRGGETADAEPALPNWKMPVDELFE